MTDKEGKDYFYAVKIKKAAYNGNDLIHEEFSYRLAPYVDMLPSADDELHALGFSDDYEGDATRGEAYVCTDVMHIEKGSRQHRRLKDRLAMSPSERTAGGV